jgi:hypothetical protein
MRRILDKIDNFFLDQADWIFVVDAPVDPFLVIEIGNQMENGIAKVFWRLKVGYSFSLFAFQFLKWNSKDKRVIRPELLVAQNHVLGHCPMPIVCQNYCLHRVVDSQTPSPRLKSQLAGS